MSSNHHNNMRQHSSLAHMHSSQRDCCLHFNGSATRWKKIKRSFIIDPACVLQFGELHKILLPSTPQKSSFLPHHHPHPEHHPHFSPVLQFGHIISYDCCSITVLFKDSPFETPEPWIESACKTSLLVGDGWSFFFIACGCNKQSMRKHVQHKSSCAALLASIFHMRGLGFQSQGQYK